MEEQWLGIILEACNLLKRFWYLILQIFDIDLFIFYILIGKIKMVISLSCRRKWMQEDSSWTQRWEVTSCLQQQEKRYGFPIDWSGFHLLLLLLSWIMLEWSCYGKSISYLLTSLYLMFFTGTAAHSAEVLCIFPSQWQFIVIAIYIYLNF